MYPLGVRSSPSQSRARSTELTSSRRRRTSDASRNRLIHSGATTATKLEHFDPEGVQNGLLSRAWRCVEEPFATVHFRERWRALPRVKAATDDSPTKGWS